MHRHSHASFVLGQALMGDNPGWEMEKFKLERSIKELKRSLKKLMEENLKLRNHLESIGATDADLE